MLHKLLAVLILLAIFPLLLLITFSLLIIQGKPIFFYHNRVGKNYKIFSLIKFRTMINNNYGSEITDINDKRITKVGRLLRKLKFDELPQIINILTGDLNFVGPRPEVEKYVNQYDFSFLNKIKPGLTDFSSILFSQEEIILSKLGGVGHYHKILLIKLELINHYINIRNARVDCKIILFTVLSLVVPKFVKNQIIKDINKVNPSLVKKITAFGL
tara:strand:+ start:928 stop:1572 length:645 start_codon:yes stop_codon:yes gene_type:complete